MKFKEGGFTFEENEIGYAVYQGRTYLGSIRAMKESNGRHCFVLGFDRRKKPATYRGMVTAAKALKAIATMKREAEKRGWEMEEIILRAWDRRPFRTILACSGRRGRWFKSSRPDFSESLL